MSDDTSALRASIPSADRADVPWWAGDNPDFFEVGPYRSRDEALGEAKAYFGADSDIYLMQARLADWFAPDASSIIDLMIDNSDELFFEDGFEDMAGTTEAIAAAKAELNELLAGWLNRWRDIFPTPTSFGWMGEQEFVPAQANEARSDETGTGSARQGESAVPEGNAP